MRKHIIKKSLIVCIILLFTFSSFASSISGFVKETQDVDFDFENSYEPEEKVVVSCHSYGTPGKPLRQAEMSKTEAHNLLDKINAFAEIIASNSFSNEAEKMQEEIILVARDYGLLPTDISFTDFQPRIFSSLERIRPKKGTTPVNGNRGTASLCNFATTGSGMQFPIVILPRLIPILLTPIPRAFLHWSANEGITTCGSYLTGTGFIAGGMQRGTALGFWGIGFSMFLPPVMAYGFIGYALFATCTAEEIESWPPNYAPQISAVSPIDGAENVAISTSELSFQISDENGDMMNYTVTTNPDIGSGSGYNEPDGTYSIPISGLEGTEGYSWYVEVSDGQKTVEESFTFTTEPVAPIVSDPEPEDGERYISIDLPQLSFRINDPQGDLMDYTVETSPDIGSGSGSNVDDGTYSVDISGLNYTAKYTWFVNVTDGEYWKHKEFYFFTEPKMVFNPFDEGWQYRKQITINHTLVTDTLSNFPVLISTVDPDLSDKAQNDGDDILFMDDIGVATRLYHEIEQYDDSSGEFTAWVNVSQVSSSSDTYLYMYYGNPSCGSQQYPEMVWDSNYIMVQHMYGYDEMIYDSTINDNDGTIHEATSTTGAIGQALHFDGDDDYVECQPNEVFDMDFPVTLEAWIYKEPGGGSPDETHDGIIYTDRYSDFYSGYLMSINIKEGDTYIYSAGFGNGKGGGGPAYRRSKSSPSTIEPYNFYQLTGVIKGPDDIILFINGQEIEGTYLGDANTVGYKGGPCFIGLSWRYDYNFHGIIDELRVSNTERSSTWISTGFNNQIDPTSFLSFGPEET